MSLRRLWAVAAGLAVALNAHPALAQRAPAPAAGQVTILNSQRIDFVSKVNGHRYRIEIAIPFGPPPEGGYPVLYVLDGDAYFASATEAVRANAPDVVVVGVGYPDDKAFVDEVLARRGPVPAYLQAATPFQAAVGLERTYDLSLAASAEVLAEQNLPGVFENTPDKVGGADDFLRTIETEIKPRVAATAQVNPGDQVLFGHSFAGLVVLRALFTEPNAFRSFIAASPSIWWAKRAVLADEARFAAQVRAGAATPRLLMTMGADEAAPPNLEAFNPQDAARIRKAVSANRMFANARDLSARLKALHGATGYEVADLAVFDHQGHDISPWPALGRAVEFAFQHEP